MLKAEVITIGDEILLGRVIDTNSAFIGKRLADHGIPLEWITSVGDDRDNVLEALAIALGRAEIVIVTGGLGPTHDDITKKVLSDFFGRKLVFDKKIFEELAARFTRPGWVNSSAHYDQATIPEGIDIMPNLRGTAPGLHFQTEGRHVFAIPGIPREMEGLMEGSILPILKTIVSGQAISHLTLRTTGVGESFLFQKLEDLPDLELLAFLPSHLGVDIRVTVRDQDEDRAKAQVAKVANEIRHRLGQYIYGENDEQLEEIIGRMLVEQKLKLAVAESCTGGLVAWRITNVPGSSAYFERGIVTYSNDSKSDLLGVSRETIDKYGAVSEQTSSEMAEGVRRIAGVDIGLSITGIAGPTGGTDQKPVGTVYIGISSAKGTSTSHFQFGYDRIMNRERTAQTALNILREHLANL